MAFKKFYLPKYGDFTFGPGSDSTGASRSISWVNWRQKEYQEEIEKMFDIETLESIAARAEMELMRHAMDSQSATTIFEDPLVAEARAEAASKWASAGESSPKAKLHEIESSLLSTQRHLLATLSHKRLRMQQNFDTAKSPAEARELLSQFALIPQVDDTSADTRIREKWRTLFEVRPPMEYAEMVKAMERDIEDAKRRVGELENQRADLESAQAAKDRERKGREEERERVRRENERTCTGCGQHLQENEEGLCCERCWNEERSKGRGGGWYCSEECAVRDAKRHNEEFHRGDVQMGY